MIKIIKIHYNFKTTISPPDYRGWKDVLGAWSGEGKFRQAALLKTKLLHSCKQCWFPVKSRTDVRVLLKTLLLQF